MQATWAGVLQKPVSKNSTTNSKILLLQSWYDRFIGILLVDKMVIEIHK